MTEQEQRIDELRNALIVELRLQKKPYFIIAGDVEYDGDNVNVRSNFAVEGSGKDIIYLFAMAIGQDKNLLPIFQNVVAMSAPPPKDEVNNDETTP